MAKVELKKPEELGPAIGALFKAVRRGVTDGAVRTAKYAKQLVIQEGRRLGIPASGAWERGWAVRKQVQGVKLVNETKHARFVEEGRQPGPLPFRVIQEWVRVKGLRAGAPSRPARTSRGQFAKSKKARGKPVFQGALERIAWAIWAKIRREGFKGRHPLRNVMPLVHRRAIRESRISVAKVCASPPRGRR